MIKECKGQTKLKLFAFTVVAIMLGGLAVLPSPNSSGAERLTNTGLIDGIDPDPSIGMHNSYGWCGEMFPQSDGDYLWVGTNHDLGGIILMNGGATQPEIYEALGIPVPDMSDMAGRIYRYNLNDTEAGWELMWTDPAINGYRKMIIFNDDLYVFAGITCRWAGYQYSLVYRFTPDFAPGDSPDVVLWDKLPGKGLEHYRAACVFNDKLYAGTFNGEIYCTDGSGLKNNTPNNLGPGTVPAGWNLVFDLKDPAFSYVFDPLGAGGIWDLMAFNGSLYAFVAGEGFRVYKIDEADGEYAIAQIVGDKDSALYGPGLGIAKHVAASPFISTQFGEDYLYVTTFANGPQFLTTFASTLASDIRDVFENIYCAPSVYRFDACGNWEVVVGDRMGPNVAVDKDGNDVPHVGNMRAGFFPGYGLNTSANQYAWWAAEYDGRLYVSTWDMGFMREAVPALLLFTAAADFGPDNTEIVLKEIYNIYSDILAIADYFGEDEFETLVSEIDSLLSECMSQIREIAEDDGATIQEKLAAVKALLEGLVQDITSAAGPAAAPLKEIIDDMSESVRNIVGTVASDPRGALLAAAHVIEMAFSCLPVILSGSDPSGFDLFFTEDGVNFSPYTVNGFGDKNNYGGRVILPTSYGLFLLTANPFHGCQVWRLDDMVPDKIYTDMPSSVTMKAGDTAEFTVWSFGPNPDIPSVKTTGGENVSVSIELIGEDTSRYYSTVEKKFSPTTYGLYKYEETPIPLYAYKLTLTGERAFTGMIDVFIEIGEFQLTTPLDVTVTAKKTGSDYTPAVIAQPGGGGGAVVPPVTPEEETKVVDPSASSSDRTMWFIILLVIVILAGVGYMVLRKA